MNIKKYAIALALTAIVFAFFALTTFAAKPTENGFDSAVYSSPIRWVMFFWI